MIAPEKTEQFKNRLRILLTQSRKEVWPAWKAPHQFRRYLLCFPEVSEDDVFDLSEEVCRERGIDFDAFRADLTVMWDKAKDPDIFPAATDNALASDYRPPGRYPKRSLYALRLMRELAKLCEPYVFWVEACDLAKLAGIPEPTAKNLVAEAKKKGLVQVVREHVPHKKCAHLHWLDGLPADRELSDDEPWWIVDARGPKATLDAESETVYKTNEKEFFETPDELIF